MIAFLAIIAQVAEANPALYSYGPLGIICAFFMWRDVSRDRERARELEREQELERERARALRELGSQVDELTKALLVSVIERESIEEATRKYARETIAKIDARSSKE